MNVSVGSFSDPDGLEGLAHFLGTFFAALYLDSLDFETRMFMAPLFYKCNVEMVVFEIELC